MRGRDPDEQHRVSSPLEVLFDLVFAIAFGLAADQLAEAVGSGDIVAGLVGLTFAAFAIRPDSLAAILPSYLYRFRPRGEFQRQRTA